MKFVVDTGSSLSFLPLGNTTDNNEVLQLRTANGGTMSTRGSKVLNFSIHGNKRKFTWKFYVADVIYPLLGLDFLENFSILIDCETKEILQRPERYYLQTTNDTESNVQTNKPKNDSKVKPHGQQGELNTKPSPLQTYTVTHDLSSRNIIDRMILKYQNIQKTNPNECEKTNSYRHSIITSDTPPLRERVRPLCSEKLEYAKKEFLKLEKDGIIQRSASPWAAPLMMVKKKDGDYRPCGDYRRLNKVTVHDSYPMKLVNDVLSRFANSKIFSTIDLAKAYHQIPMRLADIPKTAVITPFGLFEYKYMPFGLRNAAQTFQRHIDEILSKFDFALAYIDDIIIGSVDQEEHEIHLEMIFNTLHKHKLKINEAKCVFFQQEVKFLGHLVSENGIKPLPERLEAIGKLPLPKTVTQLRSFLGTVNYCHRFIPHASEILAPMSSLCNRPKHS